MDYLVIVDYNVAIKSFLIWYSKRKWNVFAIFLWSNGFWNYHKPCLNFYTSQITIWEFYWNILEERYRLQRERDIKRLFCEEDFC